MDVYHRLVTRPWSVLMLMVVAAFFVANGVFAALYLLVGGVDGMRPGHLGDAFFFSVQTLSTIGYGGMSPASTAANVLVTAESITSLLGVALVAGLVFAKFSLPISRVAFSRVACVATYEGQPALMIRMANARRNYVVEARLTLTVLEDHVTSEGTFMRRMCDLDLVRERSPFFYLSWVAIHLIDERSPLWGCSGESLSSANTRVIASFVGLDESLSQTIHARQLYRTEDLLWGQRFVDIVERDEGGVRRIDNRRLNDTEAGAAPQWCADDGSCAAD